MSRKEIEPFNGGVRHPVEGEGNVNELVVGVRIA